MSERKEGWYFIQITPRVSGDDDGWEAVKYEGGLWFMAGRADYLPEGLISAVGPRIPTPDENWQCVPKEPTQYQQNAGSVERYHRQGNCKGIYRAMLATAPLPVEES